MSQKKLAQLQAKWTAKLKAAGFKDIEQPDGNLKSWTCRGLPKKRNVISMAAASEYYRLAGHFLHDRIWYSKLERAIWELHCQGFGRGEIHRQLRSKFHALGIAKTRRIISELVAEMKATYLGKPNE